MSSRVYRLRVGGIIDETTGDPIEWVWGQRTTDAPDTTYRAIVELGDVIAAQARPGEPWASDSGFAVTIATEQAAELLRVDGEPLVYDDGIPGLGQQVRLGVGMSRASTTIYGDRISATIPDLLPLDVWIGDERLTITAGTPAGWTVVRGVAGSREGVALFPAALPDYIRGIAGNNNLKAWPGLAADRPRVWKRRPGSAIGLWATLYEQDAALQEDETVVWQGPITDLRTDRDGLCTVEIGSALAIARAWQTERRSGGTLWVNLFRQGISPAATIMMDAGSIAPGSTPAYVRLVRDDSWAIVPVASCDLAPGTGWAVTLATYTASTSTGNNIEILDPVAVGTGARPSAVPAGSDARSAIQALLQRGAFQRRTGRADIPIADYRSSWVRVEVMDSDADPALIGLLADSTGSDRTWSPEVATDALPSAITGAVPAPAGEVGAVIPIWMAPTLGEVLERYYLRPLCLTAVPSATGGIVYQSWFPVASDWLSLPVTRQVPDPGDWAQQSTLAPIGGATWTGADDGIIRVVPMVRHPGTPAPVEIDPSALETPDRSLALRWVDMVTRYGRPSPTYQLSSLALLDAEVAGVDSPDVGSIVVLDHPAIPGPSGAMGVTGAVCVVIERGTMLVDRIARLTLALVPGTVGYLRTRWAAEVVVDAVSTAGTLHTVTPAAPSSTRLLTAGDAFELCDATGAVIDTGLVDSVTASVVVIDCATAPGPGDVILLEDAATTANSGNAWLFDDYAYE